MKRFINLFAIEVFTFFFNMLRKIQNFNSICSFIAIWIIFVEMIRILVSLIKRDQNGKGTEGKKFYEEGYHKCWLWLKNKIFLLI